MREVNALWIGGKLSDMEKLCLSSWAELYFVNLYAYDEIENLPKHSSLMVRDGREILEMIPFQNVQESGTYTTFANLFRFKLLYDKGGTWIDCDIACLRPIDDLPDQVICQERVPDGTGIKPWIGFMRAVKGCSLMKHLYERALAPVNQIKFGRTSWEIISEAGWDFGFEYASPDLFTTIPWNEWQKFTSPRQPVIPCPPSYGVHLWSDMWRREGWDKNYSYPGSYYNDLKARFL